MKAESSCQPQSTSNGGRVSGVTKFLKLRARQLAGTVSIVSGQEYASSVATRSVSLSAPKGGEGRGEEAVISSNSPLSNSLPARSSPGEGVVAPSATCAFRWLIQLPFLGPKARNAIAWAGAILASAGPGHGFQTFSPGLKVRNRIYGQDVLPLQGEEICSGTITWDLRLHPKLSHRGLSALRLAPRPTRPRIQRRFVKPQTPS